MIRQNCDSRKRGIGRA